MIVVKHHQLNAVQGRKPFFVHFCIFVVLFVIDVWQIVRKCKVNFVMQLVLNLSVVRRWGNKLLNHFKLHKLVNNPVENTAPNTSQAFWHLLDTLLRASQGEIVMHFVLSKVTVLHNVSSQHASLTETDDIDVALTKHRMLLDDFAVAFNLLINIFKDGNVLCLFSPDLYAFCIYRLAFVLCGFVNQFNKVFDLAVANIIDSVDDNNRVGVLPFTNNHLFGGHLCKELGVSYGQERTYQRDHIK